MNKQIMDTSQVVYYWVEPVTIGVTSLELFTAVSCSGLIMSGLGKKNKLLIELQSLVKRYLPNLFRWWLWL